MLQISAQMWNLWVLEALCSGDMIAEVEQVIDLLVGGEEALRLAGRF